MLKLERIAKYYTSNDQVVKALDNLNLEFKRGEFVVVTGESGSGKSTLLNVLSGLDTYEDGELWVEGKETSFYAQEDWELYRKQYIGFIFQQFNIIDSYTVYQNVLLALTLSDYPKDQRKARALELIEEVGLSSHTHHKAKRLSGGQKQRVSIARALAKDAPIIVADEPTGNLDQETSKTIIALLQKIAKDKLVIMVTHDAEGALQFASRKIRLFDGEVVEDKQLRPIEVPLEPLALKTPKMTFAARLNVAARNLRSTPRKSIFTLLVSIFVVFLFTLTYGSYVEQQNVTLTTFHPYFNSLSPHRVIVVNADGTPLSDDDLSRLERLNGVQAVVPYDPVLDLFLHIRPTQASQSQSFFESHSVHHAASLTSRDLSAGRLPQAAHEIVLPVPSRGLFSNTLEVSLNDTVEVRVQTDPWSNFNPNDDRPTTRYTVVGLHSVDALGFQGAAYVHESFFEDPAHIALGLIGVHAFDVIYQGEVRLTLESWSLNLDPSIPIGEVHLSEGTLLNELAPPWQTELNPETILNTEFTLRSRNAFVPEGVMFPFQFDAIIPEDREGGMRNWGVFMHPETMNQYVVSERFQASLIVRDAFVANGLLANLDEQFFGLYPADYEEPFMAVFRVIGQVFQAASSFFLLIVMYFVAYLALRNVMRARQKDYVIMRSIGASKTDLNTITILELVLVMLWAFVLVYGVLWTNQIVSLRIPDYLRFFTFSNYVVAVILLFGMTVFLGIRFNKKIFTQSVQKALRGE